METNLRVDHYILSPLLILTCGIIIIIYGWSFYATITERPGLNGNMHDYYQLTRTQFAVYDFIIVTLFVLALIRLVYFTFKRNKAKLVKSYFLFLFFSGVIIIAEFYLSSRFTGKG